MEAATLNATDAAARQIPETKPKPTATKKAWWAEPLAPYGKADTRSSMRYLATSAGAYLALWPVMYLLLGVSYALTLLVSVLGAGFLLRTYIAFHDCAHGSFMPTKRANTRLGIPLGLLVFSPFQAWRHEHSGHHASAGDLDRRGVGDVDTWTVAEYQSRGRLGRLGYRAIRSPAIMLTIGPVWALAVAPRIVPLKARPLIRRSYLYTDVALVVLIAAVVWLIGWKAYLMIQLPMILMAGSAGVWLFYVQHQFEDVYWSRSEEWSYADAALAGSSHLRLPKVLQYFSGNIGLHHVHHLSPKIPNYNLQRAHDENEFLQRAPEISFWQGIKALRLKLIDESSGRLVTFAEARRLQAARSAQGARASAAA